MVYDEWEYDMYALIFRGQSRYVFQKPLLDKSVDTTRIRIKATLMKRTSILITDNQKLYSNLFVSILKLFPEYRVLKQASSLSEALLKLQNLRPDVVIIGNVLPENTPYQAASLIKQHSPDTRVIVITDSDIPAEVVNVMEAGASGYLAKGNLNIENIIKTIKMTNQRKWLYAYPATNRRMKQDRIGSLGL